MVISVVCKLAKGKIIMKKKLFSMILAIAMLASLAMPAFAGSSTSSGNRQESLTYTATTNIPAVTVTMPTTNTLTLNPYGMTVSISNAEHTEQIISPVQYITNKTAAAMKVAVKATATVAGNAILSAKPCTGKETTLNAFVMAELQEVSANTDEPTWIADMDDATTINEKCYPQIIPTAEGKTAPGILSVSAASSTTANYIALKIMGNLAGNPTGGWTAADKVDVKLEFTFTPGVANAVTIPTTLTTVTAKPAAAVMGTVVRLTSSDGKQPTVTDANSAAVSVTKVTDNLYYFTMPATAVDVAVSA